MYRLIICLVYIPSFFCLFNSYRIYNIDGKYHKIKIISPEEYFVLLDKGIYIYNKDFSKYDIIKIFNSSQIINNDDDYQKVTLSEFESNKNFYIFCLAQNYLYLFQNNTRNITEYNLNGKINGAIYNLIPIKNENNLLYYIIAYINKASSIYKLNFYYYKIDLLNDMNNKLESKKDYQQIKSYPFQISI